MQHWCYFVHMYVSVTAVSSQVDSTSNVKPSPHWYLKAFQVPPAVPGAQEKEASCY